jgi:hypothetical protein
MKEVSLVGRTLGPSRLWVFNDWGDLTFMKIEYVEMNNLRVESVVSSPTICRLISRCSKIAKTNYKTEIFLYIKINVLLNIIIV